MHVKAMKSARCNVCNMPHGIESGNFSSCAWYDVTTDSLCNVMQHQDRGFTGADAARGMSAQLTPANQYLMLLYA